MIALLLCYVLRPQTEACRPEEVFNSPEVTKLPEKQVTFLFLFSKDVSVLVFITLVCNRGFRSSSVGVRTQNQLIGMTVDPHSPHTHTHTHTSTHLLSVTADGPRGVEEPASLTSSEDIGQN